MNPWNDFPIEYRKEEVDFLFKAMCTGECAALFGLSGSGKSNLLGFLANRALLPCSFLQLFLVDCNRMPGYDPEAFYRLVAQELNDSTPVRALATTADALLDIENKLEQLQPDDARVCILFDRFDLLLAQDWFDVVANNLRALRDQFKFRLSYLIAARKPLPRDSELAELFYGHSIWLGPLSTADARWSARRDIKRLSGGTEVNEEDLVRIVKISEGYPSLLRAICEAHAAGEPLEADSLRDHPSIARRIAEFWDDEPGGEAISRSKLEKHPWLGRRPDKLRVATYHYEENFDFDKLTAKENLLLRYLIAHPEQVCEKDELVQAIWPGEVVFERGIRDDSLSQLVRRLRIKIEDQPEKPVHVITVPGRGYIFRGG